MADVPSSRSRETHPGARPALALVLSCLCLLLGTAWFALQRADDPRLGAASAREDGARLASKVSELEFGHVGIGTREEQRFVLFHEGSTSRPLTVYNAWLAEPDAVHFSTDFEGPVTLQPGESLIVGVRFAPQASGAWTSPLYLSHDGASGLEVFTLSGSAGEMSAGQRRRALVEDRLRRARPDFDKSTLSGIGNIKPTSLQFGPDGRLYVADMFGTIRIYTVERRGANDYAVEATESIQSIRDIPNHDDDGDPAPNVKNRLVTGLLVAGSASQPVMYVASSDPRIGGGHSHTNTNLDTNSGVISRLTRDGDGWTKVDLVSGLSRSEENHHPNGMVLDAATNRLYVAAGGNTNLGAPSNNFVRLPEYALSAAILEIDLGAIGDTPYALPTLDDDSRPGNKDRNDPFGGNDGRNQARLVPGGPVQVYAPGFRNAYDIVLTEQGRMYTVDNGGNSGWGGAPKGGSQCSNALSEPGDTQHDKLHFIDGRGYYGGHPNPTRGNQANTFNRDGQSPVSVSNPIECTFKGAGKNGGKDTFDASVNGLAEYRASNFGADLKGSLLAVGFDNVVHRIGLSDDGRTVQERTKLFSNVGGIPLDIVAQADWQTFPGTIWIADFQKKDIVVFEPRNYDGSTAQPVEQGCSSEPLADNDGDGFTNADELANGTDPCSPADLPADADGDGISDLSDPDDDNDGLRDVEDPFALDANNGRGTAIPLDHDWENDSRAPGFLFNLGFSGLMSDGSTDWQERFDTGNMTIGGAAGVLTIDAVSPGDAVADRDSQDYGFQFGIDVDADSAPFVVHTRLVAPFSGASRKPSQSLGVYIGTGDQDNYIKLVANTRGPRGGVQFAAERGGTFQSVHDGAATVYDTESVDLYLRVDPGAGQVRAYHRTREDGADGALMPIGPVAAMPDDWLDAGTALAVGIISTSTGADPFTATWDFVSVGGTDLLGEGTGDDPAEGAPGKPATAPVTTTSTLPFDSDGDGVADALDGDDDDDGIADSKDPFPLDVANGRSTPIPVVRDWSVDGGPAGFLFGLGFSGLMNDGTTDWRERLDTDGMTTAPGTGAFTLDAVSAGDPIKGRNDQDHALQFGIDVGVDTAPFVVGTRLPTPLAGAARKPHQSLGLYIGTGDQDNYIKLVANTDGQRGGVQFAAEREGVFQSVHDGAATVYDTESVELLLRVDPGAGEVRAFHRSHVGAGTGELIEIGAPATLPREWLAAETGLAVGIISTSTGSTPFRARWQYLRVDDAGALDGESGRAPAVDDGADPDAGAGAGAGKGTTDGGTGDTGGTAGADGTGAGQAGGATTGTAGKGVTDASGTLALEAEAALRTVASGGHAWTRIDDPQAVGGASMRVLPDNGTLRITERASPALEFRVGVPAAGRWYVWVRGKGDTDAAGEGKNDSVHVGLNGALGGAAAIDRFPDRWTWSRSTRSGAPAHVDVPSSGTHTLSVWMREDGFELDRLVLSPDASYVPQGSGPSAGASGDGAANPTDGTADDPTDGATGGATDDPTGDTAGDTTGGTAGGTADETIGAPVQGTVASVDGVLTLDATGTTGRIGAGGQAWNERTDGAMVALPDAGTLRPGADGSPRLDYRVNFDRAGTWVVWVHGYGDTDASGEGKNDSVHVGLDGVLDTAAAIAGFPPRWTWNRSRRGGAFATVSVDRPGEHTLNVWMREDGFAFDGLTLLGPGAPVDRPAGPGGTDGTGDADGGKVIGAPAGTGVPGGVTAPGTSVPPGATWSRRGGTGTTVVPRHEGGGVEYEGRLYVMGGRGQRAVSIFDPATDRWSTGATPPIELNHFQPVVWGDRIWVIGAMTGLYPREPNVPNVYTYTPATDTWAKGAAIPVHRQRGSMGAAVHGGRIYLLGGNRLGHDGGAVAWFDEFDPATGAWRTLPDAPNARDHAPIAIVGERLVAAGGRRTTRPNVFANMLGAVDVFDFDTGRWSTGAPIPTQRAGTMVVSVGPEVIVIGGESAATGDAIAAVEAYDVATRRWRSLPDLGVGRHGGGAAVLGDGIHVASGNTVRGGGRESTAHERLAPLR